MTPSPVFTAINLIVDGRVRHYTLAKGVYALVPLSTPNEPIRIEDADDLIRIVSLKGFGDPLQAIASGDLTATDCIPGTTFGTPIGWAGCMIAFNNDGEIVL